MADDVSEPTPTARPSRVRFIVAALVGVVLLLFLFSSGLARLYTDFLWFDRLELSSVWTTILGTRILLAVAFGVVFFVVLFANLWLADRLAPATRISSPEDELIERYQAALGRHAGRIRLGISLLFAVIAGINTSSQWQTYLLWANAQDFGRVDQLFNRDAGFYVFRLPFWSLLVDWAFASMIFVVLLVAARHYLNGGIRAAGAGTRVVPGVKTHLSLLLAFMAVLRALAYWLDRYDLVTTARGSFTGALATDVNIQLPALNLLVLISLFCGGLFLANLRRSGWGLPAMAIGLWFLSHVVVGGIVPAIYQRLRVDPVVSQREAPFIERNIEATRFAYGLDESRLRFVEDVVLDQELSSDELATYGDIFDQTLLVDPELASEAFARDQAERSYYQFESRLDVDRYLIDGQLTPVIVGARGLDTTQSPVANSWENSHVAFTHGFGIVVAPGNPGRAQNVDYVVSGLGDLSIEEGFEAELDEPRLYYGENFGGYAIVGATRDEVDFPTTGNDTALTRYEGDGGVPVSSFTRRAAYALRFQDFDFLISQFVDVDQSRVIYHRDVEDRVREIAPFLDYDADPYPVIAEGRVFWVVDGYTTSAEFPYSQHRLTTGSFTSSADLASRINYVRNSVKAVVDSFTGDVTFYVVEDEPLIRAYQGAFPELFTDIADAPDSIRDHFRYPQDIFKIQTDMYGRYYVDDPVSFLQEDLAWGIATQPAQAANATVETTTPQRPQYLVTRLPDEGELEFVLQRGFVPLTGRRFNAVTGAQEEETQRPELTAIMYARSDPENYGELVLYELPPGLIDAPDLVNSEIQKNVDVSREVTLLGQQGSEVKFGDMQTLFVGDSVVFVRPFYLVAQGANAKPELRSVIAVNGDRIGLSSTLDGALRQVTTGAPVTIEPGEVDTSAFAGLSVAELVQRVDRLLVDADAAEAAGDAATAANLRAEAIAAVGQLEVLLGVPNPVVTEDVSTETTEEPEG